MRCFVLEWVIAKLIDATSIEQADIIVATNVNGQLASQNQCFRVANEEVKSGVHFDNERSKSGAARKHSQRQHEVVYGH
jgi:hypothetical protein